MAEVIWTETALIELDEIADYLSLDNPRTAKNLVRKVFNRADFWAQCPTTGLRVKELDFSIYAEIIISPCRIFSRYDEDADVKYIIHVCRDRSRFAVWRDKIRYHI